MQTTKTKFSVHWANTVPSFRSVLAVVRENRRSKQYMDGISDAFWLHYHKIYEMASFGLHFDRLLSSFSLAMKLLEV